MGVLEYVDAVQSGTVAGDPGMEVFFPVGFLFPGKVEVHGVFDAEGVSDRYQERVDGFDELRDGFFNADGVVKVQCVNTENRLWDKVFFFLAPVNAD